MGEPNEKEAGQSPASSPLHIPVRFVGGSKNGIETIANFRIADESMLHLIDFRATFGNEVYKYHADDRTFVLEEK